MHVKGLVFRTFVATLKRVRGDEAYARVLELLPPEVAEPLRVGAMTTGSWYPIQWFAELHLAAQKACNEGVDLTRLISRESVKADFKSGVHRLVTLTLAPEWLIKSSPRIVGFYYDAGRLVVEEATTGHAMGRFEGFSGFTRDLWENVVGGSLGVLDMAGAKNPAAKILAGGGDGDGHLTFSIRWT